MSELHEKKISELEYGGITEIVRDCMEIPLLSVRRFSGESKDRRSEKDVLTDNKIILAKDLKDWAIAKIKKCKRFVKEIDVGIVVSEKAPLYCGHSYVNSSIIERCQSCKDKMKDFELTKEDLK